MNEVLKSFGIEKWILFWQMVNFGVLFLILWKFLYKPLRTIMQEREEKIQESLNKADALEKRSEKFEEELKEKMSAQRSEIEEIHEKARKTQEELKKELRAKAEEESAKIIQEARAATEQERKHILASVEKEVQKAAVLLAEKILEKEIDAKKQKELVDEALGRLKEEGGSS